MGDDRPAVIRAAADDVHLVAAERAELRLPQRPGPGVEGQALHVAVAVGPDLRPDAFLVRPRVALGGPAVTLQPQDLAGEVAEVLRPLLADEAVAGGEVELAVPGAEDDAAAVVVAPLRLRRRGIQDRPRVFQRGRALVEARADQARQRAAFHPRREAEIDLPRRREVRRQGDIEQPALAARLHHRHAAERAGDAAVAADDAHAARPLGDQQAAVGQEGGAPGVVEPLGEGDDAKDGGLRAHRPLRRAGGRGGAGGGRDQAGGEEEEKGAHAAQVGAAAAAPSPAPPPAAGGSCAGSPGAAGPRGCGGVSWHELLRREPARAARAGRRIPGGPGWTGPCPQAAHPLVRGPDPQGVFAPESPVAGPHPAVRSRPPSPRAASGGGRVSRCCRRSSRAARPWAAHRPWCPPACRP